MTGSVSVARSFALLLNRGYADFRVERQDDSIQLVIRNAGLNWISAFVMESGCPPGENVEAVEGVYWFFDHVLDTAHPAVAPGREFRITYKFPGCAARQGPPPSAGIVAYAVERENAGWGAFHLPGSQRVADMIANRRHWWRVYSWSLLSILNEWEPEAVEWDGILSRFDRLFETELVAFGHNNDGMPVLERDPLRAQMIEKLRRQTASVAGRCPGKAARHCEAFEALKAEVTRIADRVRLAHPSVRSKQDLYWGTRDLPPPLFP